MKRCQVVITVVSDIAEAVRVIVSEKGVRSMVGHPGACSSVGHRWMCREGRVVERPVSGSDKFAVVVEVGHRRMVDLQVGGVITTRNHGTGLRHRTEERQMWPTGGRVSSVNYSVVR